MAFRKITNYSANIKDLPNRPSDAGISADELKAFFDGRTDKEIKQIFNALIDELIMKSAAGQLGAEKLAEDDYSEPNIQAKLIYIRDYVNTFVDTTVKNLQAEMLKNEQAALIGAEKLAEDDYSEPNIQAKLIYLRDYVAAFVAQTVSALKSSMLEENQASITGAARLSEDDTSMANVQAKLVYLRNYVDSFVDTTISNLRSAMLESEQASLIGAEKLTEDDHSEANVQAKFSFVQEQITEGKNRIQPVEKGGTGATTAEEARSNLGVASARMEVIIDGDATNGYTADKTVREISEHDGIGGQVVAYVGGIGLTLLRAFSTEAVFYGVRETTSHYLRISRTGKVEYSTYPLTTLATFTIPAGRMRGDINGDGHIDGHMNKMDDLTTDLGLMYAHVMGINTLTDNIQLECADVDGDGLAISSDLNTVFNLAAGTFKLGQFAFDITNTWTVNPNYETEEGQFYKDITVAGMTATSDATIIINDTAGNARFVKAECMAGAIRIYATAVPIAELTAFVSYVEGTGETVISTAYPNGIVPISKGGTGADNATDAVANLGITAESIGAAAMIVNITGSASAGFTADKTAIEVYNAFRAGRTIYATNGNRIYTPTMVSDTGYIFANSRIEEDNDTGKMYLKTTTFSVVANSYVATRTIHNTSDEWSV